MRVLFVSRSIPLHPGTGGMERVAWDLAKSISETNPDVTVLTTAVAGKPQEFFSEGIRVITIPGTTPGRYSASWWFRSARFKKARTFETILSVSGAATAMVHTQRGPKYVFQAHGTALGELKSNLKVRARLWPLKVFRYSYWAFLDAITYRRVDSVIAASEQVAAALRIWPYGGAWVGTELRVIPNATDTEHFVFDAETRRVHRSALGTHESQRLVLTVSRLDRQKGADRVIDALTHCPADLVCAVGGVGPAETDLKRQAQESGNSSRVVFLGEMDRNAVKAALNAADLFVLPVRNFAREALPLTVLEALATGLPVIVPVGTSWPGDIAPLLVFVDVADEKALADAITRHTRSTSSRSNRLPSSYSLKAWADRYFEPQNQMDDA